LVAEVLEQTFHAFLNHLIVIFLGRDHLLQVFGSLYPFTGSTDLIDDLSKLKRNDSFGT